MMMMLLKPSHRQYRWFSSIASLSGSSSLEVSSKYDEMLKSILDQLKEEGRYRVFTKIKRLAGRMPLAEWYPDNGKPVVVKVWCSNDYLGMSGHAAVIEAGCKAIATYGTGSGGTRNISGNCFSHFELEEKLAKWHRKERALLFSSGYIANEATLSSLLRLPNCIVFSDELNHASMILGMKNSGCDRQIFPHNNVDALARLLKRDVVENPNRPRVIAVESVYSMSGTVAPLRDIVRVAKEFGALTYVDEVHAVGIYGASGAGIAERDGVAKDIDVIQGTLAKAIGVVGGYIAGSANIIDFIRSVAPSFIFTTSPPPSNTAAALKSIEIISSKEGTELRQSLLNQSRYLVHCLRVKGLAVNPTHSHVVTVHVGDPFLVKSIADSLLRDHGIYVQPINYPTVPRGKELLRLTPSPHHTEEMMDELVEALQLVFARHGIFPLKDNIPNDRCIIRNEITLLSKSKILLNNCNNPVY